jgi:uncharacterized protein YbjT (DUF2867 family)
MSDVALIAGATGLVGSSLLDLLLKSDRYSKVISLQRGHAKVTNPKLVTIQTDFTNLDSIILPDVTEVFCCLGTTIKKAGSKEQFRKVDYEFPLALAKLGAKAHAKHFLIVTAMGANASSFFFYNKVKGEVEQQLSVLTGIPAVSVLRPSLLLGKRAEKRTGESIGIVLAEGINNLFKTSIGIQAADVAKAMYALAKKSKQKGITYYASNRIKEIAASA